MIESDCTVFVTRFTDGTALFLNNGSTEAHVRHDGRNVVRPPHTIMSNPNQGKESIRKG
ncbi:MAG: hypothetical protein ACYC27_12595 [Armatimonadota bacterium]